MISVGGVVAWLELPRHTVLINGDSSVGGGCEGEGYDGGGDEGRCFDGYRGSDGWVKCCGA